MRNTTIFKLALRMLARDWRAGELRVLALALVVAVTSVTSVGFFADRIKQAMLRDAHQLLGGDVLLDADHPWSNDIPDEIKRRGLKFAQLMSFVSMARGDEATQLSGVKAVSEGYPLRGKMRIAPALNSPDEATEKVPERGSVWVDERLALALERKVGDNLQLGDASLRIGAILTLEPDRNASFFNIAPRLLMRIEDVAATGLVQTGSRIRYNLLAAGERGVVSEFEAWVKSRLARGETLQSLENASPQVRQSIERGEQFIGLTALLAVILAAVAVSLSTRRYTARHLDGFAVMRCFGATQARLFSLSACEFAILGAMASVVGCLLGFFAQFVIAALVQQFVGAILPTPSLLPVLQGLLVGLALLLGFALPPLLQLKNVPALRVLRRDLGAPNQASSLAWGLGLLVIGTLLVWQAGSVKLGLTVLLGFTVCFALFGMIAYAGLSLAGRAGGGAGVTWRYGMANLKRHARANTVQVLALALGLTAVLMLSFTLNDLISTWSKKLPPDAPNRFLVNIQPGQIEAIDDMFKNAGITAPAIYPMVRGRYVAHNGQPLNIEAMEERERRSVEREFNLSFMESPQPYNTVVAGEWFSASDMKSGAFSVEEGMAKRRDWKIGDTLTWQVAGRNVTAPITSIRKLDWDSMRVNFFVIGTPSLLRDAPASYISAFHLPEGKLTFANSISQRLPNLTLVDMSAIVRQAQLIIDQVVQAVRFVFLFALAAGVLVLYSALLATQDERAQEAALMRALGASRAQILAAQRAEFLVLGLLSGFLAAAGASVIGWSVSYFVFQFPYQMNPWVWLAGPLAGLVCVAWNARAGARAALNHPPLLVLREV
ncbi:MAG: ABC transporter permease [Burkholderiales bacterium]